MKVYRLETKSGTGVYGTGLLWSSSVTEDYNGGPGTRHPGPHRDTLFCKNHLEKLGSDVESRAFSNRYVFGFASPAQLLRWFFNRSDLGALGARGIQVSVYECDDVIVGNTQVAFAIWHHSLFVPVAVFSPYEFYDMFAGTVEAETGETPKL